jgi:myosin heavy subunit
MKADSERDAYSVLHLFHADLLEKSRVTFQQPGLERNYHIFYWLLSNKYPQYAGKILLH